MPLDFVTRDFRLNLEAKHNNQRNDIQLSEPKEYEILVQFKNHCTNVCYALVRNCAIIAGIIKNLIWRLWEQKKV